MTRGVDQQRISARLDYRMNNFEHVARRSTRMVQRGTPMSTSCKLSSTAMLRAVG